MRLLKDWELDLFNKAQEAREYIKRKHIKLILIEPINETTVKKYWPTKTDTIEIRKADGIDDVYITMKFKGLTFRNVERFKKTRLGIIAVILSYFSERKWDLTSEIKNLVLENKKL